MIHTAAKKIGLVRWNGTAGAFLALLPLSASALPTPELVIGVFGSAAQLVGMLFASVGAAWFGVRKSGSAPVSQRVRKGLIFVSALLLISLAANVWQAWQHMEQQARRLQTNLLRAPPPSHPIRQELSIRRTTINDLLNAKAGTAQTFNIIDVREPEEFELGHMPGAQTSRYADLLGPNRKLLRRDIPNVLVCDSGWRSGEICTELARMGYPCRYVEGGYAKWTLDDRSMAGTRAGQGPGLQSLPHYAQEAVLLDTPDVAALVRSQNAQLIDVRPADEFAQSHLPGAINIPMREALTADLNTAIQALPPNPLIAVCYDNRSCFYSKVFGLRVSRMGMLYAGRYTVPGEYPIPARLNQSQLARRVDALVEQGSFWASKPALWVLETVLTYTQSLLYSIVALALLLRLVFALPTYWADRDRRLGIARHPLPSFFWAFFQLLVMAVSIDVVANAADLINSETTANAGSDWADMGTPRWALGLLVAILMVYLAPLVKMRSPWRWLVIALVAAGAGYALDTVSRGVMVYLLCSLAALLVQQWLTIWWWRERPALVLPLVGPKAQVLARLRFEKMPVPDFFVVDAAQWLHSHPLQRAQARLAVRKQYRQLRLRAIYSDGVFRSFRVAVRSAARNEDLTSQSMAGHFLTLLNVKANALNDAIDQVCASMANPGELASFPVGSVLIQTMVDAEFSGVLFTEHPRSSGVMLVELGHGTAAVADGKATPRSWRVGRVSGVVHDSEPPPFALPKLWQLGVRIEALIGPAQDIEWAYRKGRFYVLQARAITRRVVNSEGQQGLREAERLRQLQSAATWQLDPYADWLVLDDTAAELPHASRLSLSLLADVHGRGGSIDQACHKLGIIYFEKHRPNWTLVFGQTRRVQIEAPRKLRQGVVAQLQFSRNADAFTQAVVDSFLPNLRDTENLRGSMDISLLDNAVLLRTLKLWRDEFVHSTYTQVATLNLIASIHVNVASKMLQKLGLDAATYLQADRPTPDRAAMTCLMAARDEGTSLDAFFLEFGHRASNDFELADARYIECEPWVRKWQASLPLVLPSPAGSADLPKDKSKALQQTIERARAAIAHKEWAKHECARALANLRTLLLEIDQRLGLGGHIFQLDWADLGPEAPLHAVELRLRAAKTSTQNQAFAKLLLPTTLSITSLETLDLSQDGFPAAATETTGLLRGTCISGHATFSGATDVRLDSGTDIETARGDILVIPNADPAWIALFPQYKAIVCETGGWLCHAAIMARELGLHGVFGVQGATRILRTGTAITIHVDGTLEQNVLAA